MYRSCLRQAPSPQLSKPKQSTKFEGFSQGSGALDPSGPPSRAAFLFAFGVMRLRLSPRAERGIGSSCFHALIVYALIVCTLFVCHHERCEGSAFAFTDNWQLYFVIPTVAKRSVGICGSPARDLFSSVITCTQVCHHERSEGSALLSRRKAALIPDAAAHPAPVPPIHPSSPRCKRQCAHPDPPPSLQHRSQCPRG